MRSNLLILFSCSALLCSCGGNGSGSAGSSSWHHFRGDASMSGYTATALPENPTLLWSHRSHTRAVASPVVDSGVVYWGDKKGNIRGVNAAGDSCFFYHHGAPLDAHPLIRRGVLYVGSSDGRMCALSLAARDTLWTFSTWGHISGAPCHINGRLVFGSYDSYVYSVDAASGKELARVASGYYINGSVAGWSGHALYGGCDGWLRMVDVDKGAEVAAEELRAYIPASAAVSGSAAYVCDYAGNLYEFSLGRGTMALKKMLYEADGSGETTAMPAVSADMVCSLDGDGHLRAFSRASGREIWRAPLTGKAGESSPLICRNRVIACSKSGHIAILNAATGEQTWEYDTGEQLVSSPAVVSGRFYVLTAKGTLLCFAAGSKPHRKGNHHR